MAQPDLIPMPFAENATPGTIEPIEATTPTVPQDATWSTGFPQVTMQPLAAGGIPPRGQNFNGVLNALSRHIFHMQGGGQYKWSDDHGPYSIGDVLQSDDGLRSYVSVVDNNTDNFNTNPSAIGNTWLPWSGGAASELVAGLMKIATTAQAQALTADDVVITPKKLGDAMNAHVLGMGQTWQDVGASRSFNTIYANTTGRSIEVSVAAQLLPDPGQARNLRAYVNNILAGACDLSGTISAGNAGVLCLNFTVPSGAEYRVESNSSTVSMWSELR